MLFFHLKHIVFSFCLNFIISMKSDKTVTYLGHTYAGRPCVGISLCSLCVLVALVRKLDLKQTEVVASPKPY